MEIIVMDGLPRGIECKKKIEELVEAETDGRIVIWDHKNLVNVESVDAFHKIAQGCGVNNIKEFDGLLYYIRVPQLFTFFMGYPEANDFKNKYGEQYKFVEE